MTGYSRISWTSWRNVATARWCVVPVAGPQNQFPVDAVLRLVRGKPLTRVAGVVRKLVGKADDFQSPPAVRAVQLGEERGEIVAVEHQVPKSSTITALPA